MSTLYKMNPIYDILEGIGMGATVAYTIVNNIVALNGTLILPIQPILLRIGG
jgi:hypothetical protein